MIACFLKTTSWNFVNILWKSSNQTSPRVASKRTKQKKIAISQSASQPVKWNPFKNEQTATKAMKITRGKTSANNEASAATYPSQSEYPNKI